MKFRRKHGHTITGSFITLDHLKDFLEERRASIHVNDKIEWSISLGVLTLIGKIRYPKPDVYDELLYIEEFVPEEKRAQVLKELKEELVRIEKS